MITLNDYLYSGDTVFKILKKYAHDLQESAVSNQNEVDLIHCRFLMQIMDLLEHNDFLTAQSQKIRELNFPQILTIWSCRLMQKNSSYQPMILR